MGDSTGFPLVIDLGETRLAGLLLAVVGTGAGGFPGWMLYQGLLTGEAESGFLAMCAVFAAAGVGLLGFGVHRLCLRGKIRVGPGEVVYQRRSLLGEKSWVEPLSRYQGVLYTTERRGSSGSDGVNRLVYVVRLQHEDPNRCVTLEESGHQTGARRRWEETARLLELPALHGDGGEGFVRRESSQLDASIRDRAGDAGLPVDFDTRTPPPPGVSVRQEARVWIVTIGNSPKARIAYLVLLLVPLGLLYIGCFRIADLALAGVAIAFGGILLYGVLAALLTTPELRLSPHEIESRRRTPFGERRGRRIPVSTIEELVIKKKDGSIPSLYVVSDEAETEIGQGLDGKGLEWLRGCILSAVLDQPVR